eukprot:jgi/Orpsp1_1/1182466/evm.model.c7180000081406.1
MKYSYIFLLQFLIIISFPIVLTLEFKGNCEEIYNYLKEKQIYKGKYNKNENNHSNISKFIGSNIELEYLYEIEKYFDAVAYCDINYENKIYY